MNNFLQKLALGFARIPDLLRPIRWPVLIVFLLGTVFCAVGITRFELDTSIDAWLSDEDGAVQALDKFREQFGGDDGLFLVYRAKDGDVFSPTSLEAIRDLTSRIDNWADTTHEALGITEEEFGKLDHITRVQSLSNTRYQINEGDTLASHQLLPDDGPVTDEMAEQARQIALGQPNLRLLMFSDNFEYGALLISTDFGAIPIEVEADPDADTIFAADELDEAASDFSLDFDEDAVVQTVEFEDTEPATYMGFMAGLSAIYDDPGFTEHFEFYPIGTAGMIDFSMDTMVQAGLLALVALVLIILLLYTLFGTGSAVFWPTLAIAASCIWVIGGMSWLGVSMTQMISLTVMLVLAVGIADCVHVMSEYMYFKRLGDDHETAMRHCFEKTGVPILLTTITTAAGMLAIAAGGVGQFVTFGISSALGVFAAFFFTILVLPVLLEFWHPHPVRKTAPIKEPGTFGDFLKIIKSPFRFIALVSRKIGLTWLLSAAWLQPLLDKVPAFSHRFRYPIVAVFVVLFSVCAYGTTQVKIDSNVIELFKEDTPIRTAYEIVDEHMAGTGNMEVMLDMGQSDAMADHRVLQAVDALQGDFETRYADYVVRTASLADLVKLTNQTMNDDDPAYHIIPSDSQAVSQLLFLFNSSNPEDRRGLVSDDYSKSHITVQLRNAGSHEYAEIFQGIDEVIAAHFEHLRADFPNMKVELTGTFALLMQMSDMISKSQLDSLTLAILIISGLLILTLGSVQGGLLAIIPNMLPAVFAFGAMGLLGIPLDTDTLMIAPLIIGIAVDDTIHFVTHYRMALATGKSATDSLVQTVKEVGQAVTFTTLVLGVSFAMLTFSAYLGLAKVGIFGSAAIFLALLCDLLFLPALIYIFQPKFGVKDAGQAHFKEKEVLS